MPLSGQCVWLLSPACYVSQVYSHPHHQVVFIFCHCVQVGHSALLYVLANSSVPWVWAIYVSFPWNKDAALCPATTLLRSWLLAPGSIIIPSPHGCTLLRCFSQLSLHTFLAKLQSKVPAIGHHGYTGHSFCQGGATHALNQSHLDAKDAITHAAFIRSMYCQRCQYLTLLCISAALTHLL